jgi:hypothetical protein
MKPSPFAPFDGKEKMKGDPKLRAYLELSKHIFSKDIASLMRVIKQWKNC